MSRKTKKRRLITLQNQWGKKRGLQMWRAWVRGR